MHSAEILSARFPDPVLDAQAVFRLAMDALSHPGMLQSLSQAVAAPAPLTGELAALALTLFDPDTAIWLDPSLAASADVKSWLAFQTSAPLAETTRAADFALVRDVTSLPALADFALGSDEYPDRSTTLVIAVESLAGGAPLRLKGPGIKDEIIFSPKGLPDDFVAQWTDNRALFPRGVDLLLVAPGGLVGLPRTTRIALEA